MATAQFIHTYGADGANNKMLPPQLIEVYDKLHLMRVTNNAIWTNWGQQRFVPAGSGAMQTFATRYKNLAPATTPLTEGVTPGGSNITREKIQMRVAQFGDFVEYTDILDLFDVDNVKQEFISILGDQAADTLDIVCRDGIVGGTNVIYAGGVTDTDAVADGNHIATEADFQKAQLRLRKAKAQKWKEAIKATTSVSTKPIRARYIAIIDPNFTETLRDKTKFPNFVGVENYPNSDRASEYEVGSLGDICFIESDNAAMDETAGAGNDKTVHKIIIIAKEAYANVSVRGNGGTKIIVKPMGSSGTSDPLDQRGTVGWKAFSGSRILNNQFMVRIESMAAFDVKSGSYAGDTITDGGDTITTDPGSNASNPAIPGGSGTRP